MDIYNIKVIKMDDYREACEVVLKVYACNVGMCVVSVVSGEFISGMYNDKREIDINKCSKYGVCEWY